MVTYYNTFSQQKPGYSFAFLQIKTEKKSGELRTFVKVYIYINDEIIRTHITFKYVYAFVSEPTVRMMPGFYILISKEKEYKTQLRRKFQV